MSWFPHFLSPLAAVVAAGIAVPSLLILYFLKLRRREMAVSSTLLWKKAIQDLQVNAPFQKLRRNLLLMLQLALLLALCLALSRPVANYTPGAGKTSVILIDRSASMNTRDIDGKSRLDEAKRRAKDLVSSMGRNSSATVIAFDDKAETIQGFTTDVALLKRKIDDIQPTDRKTKLKLAYQLAQANFAILPEQLRPGAGGTPDVYVYSDGRVSDANDVSIHGNVKYDRIGTDTAGNIGIVALSAKRNYERPTEVQVFARLANYGAQPVRSQVTLSVQQIDPKDPATSNAKPAVRSIAEVALAPERWNDAAWIKAHPSERDEKFVAKNSVEFTLDLTTAAVITVEQTNKENDTLAADDVAHVVIPSPKPLSVLLVTDGNYFLEKAMASLNLDKPVIMLPTAYEAKTPGDYDVIIFDRYSPKQLPPSGNFIYFGALAPNLKLKIAQQDGHNAMVDDVGVLDWRRDHPMLRYLSLTKLYAAQALKLDVPPEAEVLIEGTKGPMLVLDREGKNTHLVVTFDLLQSNWPLRVSFPIFLHNALQYMAVGSELDVRQSLEPGATPRIPRANIDRAGEGLKSIRLNGPDGSRELTLTDGAEFALPALDRVGVYTTQPPIPQYERIAVNLLDANESNVMPVETAPGGVGEAIATTAKKSRLELWWWIVACAAIPLLLIEWWVYTRRVHL